MMRLKELRKQEKKNQSEIANQLQIPLMTYNNYENEKSEPNIETLIKLANYYNVSLDYLVGRDFGNELGYLTQEQFENFKLIMKLNAINQYKVFGYATSLLENQ